MRAVVTRVKNASVEIGGKVNGAIGQGFLVLLGVGPGDTAGQAAKLADKGCGLRVVGAQNEERKLDTAPVGARARGVSPCPLSPSTPPHHP